MDQKQHERYTNTMMTWGHGYGLFHPASDDEARPGVCGYVDESGIWQKIVDLGNEAELTAAKLSKPAFALLKPIFKEQWGPKYTSTVKEINAKTEVGLSGLATGIPAEFSTVLNYSLMSSFGAVLLCSDEVTLKTYPHKDPFRKWARLNSKKILKSCGDVANCGFYVMTTTWSARDIYLNAWSNKENSVTIGIKGEVPQAGTVSGSVDYYRGGSAGGWHHPKTIGDESKVIFFGGVYFKFNKLLRRFDERLQRDWTGYLGSEDEGKFLIETNDEAYEVEQIFI